MHRALYLFSALALFVLPSCVSAATLELWPEQSSVAAGETVRVRVLVESDTALNAVDGRITFPPQLLSIVSVSKESSIVSLWVQEPVYSNSAGTIEFSGGVPNPGYTGPQRRVITITFRAKEQGSARLAFASASVLANDGAGTDILTQSQGTTLTIGAGAAAQPVEVPEEVLEPQPVEVVPQAPVACDLRTCLFEITVPLVYFVAYIAASLLVMLWLVCYYILGLRIRIYRVGTVSKNPRQRKIVEE